MKTRDVRPVLTLVLTVALMPLLAGHASAAGDPSGESSIAALPAEPPEPIPSDWLVMQIDRHAGVFRGANPHEIILTNGLVRRTFRLAPNAATVGFDNLMTGQSLLRGVKPEAILQIDGTKYNVGGLLGQPDYAYLLPQWLGRMTADPRAFQFTGFRVGAIKPRFAWKRVRRSAGLPWPPPGVSLTLCFKSPQSAVQAGKNLGVEVHYELYDGIPLLAKWITVRNQGADAVHLNWFAGEVLAVVEHGSVVDDRTHWQYPNLYAGSDYAFHGMDPQTADHTTHWLADPQYTTQVNYRLQTPCLLESFPPIGPDALIAPGASFESFRTFEMPYDSTDRERKGLAVRRMFRTLAPWVTENPILMHVTRSDPASVKRAVDQCADTGFEMVIMSFGSGFNIENQDPAYVKQIKNLVSYANGKHVELGGYTLLASRDDCGPDNEVINPKTHRPGGAIFGHSPCLASRWGEDYFRKLRAFCTETGLNAIENDGSYPGDVCASTTHPGHRGLDDSQWAQWKIITGFYQWCRGRGIYLNVPDLYFLNGSNKTGMGYREDNWSLPRARQIIHGRQNIYDGTWEKTPTMGWMFVPLTQYHGGGAAATIEPLDAHLDAYAAQLANNFGAGVQACYRGPRLYDSPGTRALVKKWVDFYKRHRGILDSDIIHVRRADGRDIDCILHVNPRLACKGLAMIYNPLDQPVHRTLRLPLYYTGLTTTATVRPESGPPRQYTLDRRWNIDVTVDIAARGSTWLEIH